MKFQHLLQNYSVRRAVVGPMPAFVEYTARDYCAEPYTSAVVRRLELQLYCEFILHPLDTDGHAQRHAEAQLMHMLYGKVQELAWDIESRLYDLGIHDQKLFQMVKDLQRVEV